MRTLLLISLLVLTACSKQGENENCLDFTNTLWVSDEVYGACMNTVDSQSRYSVIAISGGDLSITDPVAYKADLVATMVAAKARATRVIYFSSRAGTASGAQYSAAVEAATEQSITVYDLYSMSVAKPDTYPQWVEEIVYGFR